MASFRKAFALSKDDVLNATPPGTSTLMDRSLVRTETGHHDTEENHIHLVPEPSSDPADPLNFAMWRKLVILAILSVYAFVANFSSSVIASALPSLVTAWAEFSPEGEPISGLVSFSTLVHLVAVNSLMLGAANILWVPLSNTIGRRPVLLLNLAILTGCSVWCGKAATFNSILAGRVIQGCGGAAADTLAPDVVGRIFFVHQRGRALAVYTIFLVLGSLVGGAVGGYITVSPGWRWTMYISAILSGAVFLAAIFFLPETMYDRPVERDLMTAKVHEHQAEEKIRTGHIERVETRHDYAPYTFSRSLGFMQPTSGFFKRLVTPYTTLALPGTWMVMLLYAGLVGLVVSISTLAPELLEAPPYLWGENAGLINIGGIVGALLGAAYTYFTADWVVKRSARREVHGFSEPEKRLPLMFPALVVATTGPLVFGFCAQYPSAHGWVGLQFGLGMVSFGLMQIPSIGFNYIIESYGALASDCFLMVVAFRAIISFAYTFFVGSWSDAQGPAQPFGIFCMLMGLFSLTVIPVWLYGKKMRIATAEIVIRGITQERLM